VLVDVMLITGKEKRALSNVNGYLMSAKMELGHVGKRKRVSVKILERA